jgi:hypothetical protein
MTHWLAGSLRENFWDRAADGGPFDGGAPDDGCSLGVAEGTAVVVAAVGVAVGPEVDGADAGEATRLSGEQAAKAVIPAPAANSAVKDRLLGRLL